MDDLDDDQIRLMLQMVSQLDEGICCADPSGRLFYVNEAARMLFAGSAGLDAPMRAWPHVYGLIDPRTGRTFELEDVPLVRALRGESVRDVEIEVRTPHILGNVISVSARPLLHADGTQLGAVCTFRDITSRKRQELALRASEWQKAAILDHIPFATWLKDREGRYIAVNAAFTEISRIARGDAVGRSDAELWDPERAKMFSRGDADVMANERPLREEQHLEEAPFHIRAEILKSPLYDPDGVLVGTIGLARDVTAERDAEQALIRANEELEMRVEERTRELERVQASLVRQERLAALGQLAGGVAHQMRNPLAAITSASYVLRRHLAVEASADAKLALEIILEEARHANDIITGLLDYTRTREAIVRTCDVATLVERALGKARATNSIRLELSLPPELRVVVDVEQVTSALTNLIDNAFDAMAGGGVLTIVAELPDPGAKPGELNPISSESAVTLRSGDHAATPPPRMAVRSGDQAITPAPRISSARSSELTLGAPRTSEVPAAPERFVHVTLSDTGSGIPYERRADLFTPLFTTKPLGLGLGLVTARTLIERQGGGLEYVPPVGSARGATFLVRLPASDDDPGQERLA